MGLFWVIQLSPKCYKHMFLEEERDLPTNKREGYVMTNCRHWSGLPVGPQQAPAAPSSAQQPLAARGYGFGCMVFCSAVTPQQLQRAHDTLDLSPEKMIWIPGLQTCIKINLWCLSYWVYGNLLQQTSSTHVQKEKGHPVALKAISTERSLGKAVRVCTTPSCGSLLPSASPSDPKSKFPKEESGRPRQQRRKRTPSIATMQNGSANTATSRKDRGMKQMP